MAKVDELIEQYLKQYPDEEWGCAHIVLSDDNLDNESVQFCIQRGKAFLDGKLPEFDYNPDNTRQTIEFLEQLLAIPEDERLAEIDD